MNETMNIDIDADLERAWAALLDVTTWPRWTASMRSVERLDDGPLRVGSRAKIKQPGMLPLVWEVTELRDRESFVWAAKSPGVRSVGVHRIAPNPDGSTRMTLEIQLDGPLAGIVGAMVGARNRRFMALEAAGLKAASEA
ncbi:MAG TPA: SRPBCC family protein [Micromonosporaceae bacterium]|jgi:uncharacterized membrane protein